MEHRSALITDMELAQATGYAERDTALQLLRHLPRRARQRTVAGDKGHATKDFVADSRERYRAWFLMTGAIYNVIRIAAPDAAAA